MSRDALLRYVVLHHVGVPSPHFDFLYEGEPGAALTSFRCPRWPPAVGDVLEELPEHRRAYLDYEGDVSGGRGRVTRVEAGELRTQDLTVDPPAFAVSLSTGAAIVLTHQFETTGGRATSGKATLWTVTAITPAITPAAR